MKLLSDRLKSIERGELLMPVLRKFLVKEHKLRETGQKTGSSVTIEDAKLSVQGFKDRIVEAETHDEDPEGEEYFHPSQFGSCYRAKWYAKRGAPINGNPQGPELLRSHMILETGTYVHMLFQNLCDRAGVLESREKLIKLPDRRIEGHADGVLRFPKGGRALLEIKTINSRGFSSLQVPHHNHKQQAMTYMNCLSLPKACIVYLEKDRHGVKEFVVDYDHDFFVRECVPRINEFHRAITHTWRAPRQEGKSINAPPCMFCNYSKLCFSSMYHKAYEAKLKKEGAPWLKIKPFVLKA